MKLSRKNKKFILESASTSDLAFILIIYFLVIAGFNVNLGIRLELPDTSSVRITGMDEIIQFDLLNTGALIFDGRQISMDEAENIIRINIENNPDLALLLLIDSEASWQNLVFFVEAAQKNNVEYFSFNLRP